MSAKRVRPPHLALTVVLDTNALFTGSASNFLKKEVADLIEQNANLPDLTIRWIVPEVVRHERQFQMLQEASKMLPTIERLERLLGHNLNITQEIIDARVREAVDRQVQQYAVVVQPLNSADVDWARIILDAAYRKPPFQLGEKEKGFRDALIVETFLQIVSSSPTSRSVARLALVSNDQLLRDAAQSRLGGGTNVHVFESIDALKGLINTLGSAVDEQYIARIKEGAAELFFKSGDESTLYYKASVGATLPRILAAALKPPAGADYCRIGGWALGSPEFVRKEGQRIYWTTRFEAKLTAVKSVPPINWATAAHSPINMVTLAPSQYTLSPPPTRITFAQGPGVTLDPRISTPSEAWGEGFNNLTLAANLSESQSVASGTASLDVSWSLAVATSGALTKPRVESVDFVEVVWGQGA